MTKSKSRRIKKSWEPFRRCLLNSTVYPANFHPMLLSRQFLNGFQDFFLFNILKLFRYKTIETHAHSFLPINISAVGSVTLYLSQTSCPRALYMGELRKNMTSTGTITKNLRLLVQKKKIFYGVNFFHSLIKLDSSMI